MQDILHARYSGNEAVFDFSGNLIEGNIGIRAQRLVGEWCADRQDAIQKAWELATQGKELPWVLPIR